jgi:triacylglycerol lipase
MTTTHFSCPKAALRCLLAASIAVPLMAVLVLPLGCASSDVLTEAKRDGTVASVTEIAGNDVDESPLGDTPVDATPPDLLVGERRGPPYPIVFVHGFSGFTDLGPLNYFYGVVDRYAAVGTESFAPAQPPYAGVAQRAAVLGHHLDAILSSTNRQKAHLICHSQGGLDCRFVASQLGYDDRIASIITIATPHYGTPLADMADVAPDGTVNVAGRFMAWMLGLMEGAPPDDAAWENDEVTEEAWASDMMGAVVDMTTDGAAAFNAAVPDHPSVPIFSVAGVSSLRSGGDECAGGTHFDMGDHVDSLDPLLLMSAGLIGGITLRRNDGIVPTDSMRWGTFLGCIPADHFDQVGQLADQGPSLVSGFDHRDFYDTLLGFVRGLEAGISP